MAKKQKGIALLLLVVVLALTISIYYFSNISITKIQADKLLETQVALKQAKQLLLGYAITRADITDPSPQAGRYGFLPCPSNDNLTEGGSDGVCGATSANTLGWFPWRSLGVSPIKDGNGGCLLYAVSGDYKVAPTTGMLNEDSNGMFQVVDDMGMPLPGNTASDRVVAVIFSAGDALTGQVRMFQDDSQCGNDDDNYSAYLDSLEVSPGDVVDNSALATGNADEVYRIVKAATATNKAVINDQFITISRNEIWSAITARSDFNDKMSNLTEALAVCLSTYATKNGKNRLPWPAPMDLSLSPGDYRLDNNYDDNADATPGYAGRYPFIVDDSNGAIVIAAADDALFIEAACDSLVLPDATITLDLLAGEYMNLWQNWKDHFFYVVSQEYAPALTTVDIAAPPCPGNCITVEGTDRAAAVIFAGSSIGQTRTGPPDANTKNAIANYIENGNETKFPDNTGNEAYVKGGNDIMFCIDIGLGVVPC